MLSSLIALKSTVAAAAGAPSIVTSSASNHAGATSYTKSFTVAANSNRKLIVGFTTPATGSTISNVRWGGSGGAVLTQISSVTNVGLRTYWYELINPTSGTNNIYWQVGGTDDMACFAVDIKDAQQSLVGVSDKITGFGSTVTSASLALTSVANSLFLYLLCCSLPTVVPVEAGDGAQLANQDVGGECRMAASSHTATTATTVTMTWTFSSNWHASAMFFMRPV